MPPLLLPIASLANAVGVFVMDLKPGFKNEFGLLRSPPANGFVVVGAPPLPPPRTVGDDGVNGGDDEVWVDCCFSAGDDVNGSSGVVVCGDCCSVEEYDTPIGLLLDAVDAFFGTAAAISLAK